MTKKAGLSGNYFKTQLQRQIEATDKQIDALVYKLYGPTDEELDRRGADVDQPGNSCCLIGLVYRMGGQSSQARTLKPTEAVSMNLMQGVLSVTDGILPC
jgi:hypothetical protein